MFQIEGSSLPSGIAVDLADVGKSFRPRVRVSRRDGRQRLRMLCALFGICRQDSLFGCESKGDRNRAVLHGFSASFRVGTVVGITGNSGCGKSALMKVIAGVTPPTQGVIRVRGKLVKLLDIEDMNQNFTAHDVLRDEVAGKISRKSSQYEEMLDFAGLSNFADVPVRKYSTGMRLRLAMASVLCQAADVILIDDYSAVGDLEFQRKCHERIRELAQQGATVIVASSDLRLLENMCDELLWMDAGSIISRGSPKKVLAEALAESARIRGNADRTSLENLVERNCFRLVDAFVREALIGQESNFSQTTPLRFGISVEAILEIDRVRLALTLFNEGKQVLRTVLRDQVNLPAGKRLDANVVLPAFILAPGRHEVELFVESERAGEREYIKLRSALSFYVNGNGNEISSVFHRAGDAVVAAPDLRWTCTPL